MLTTKPKSCKPESWDKFLEDIANNCALKGKQKNVFLARFAYENKCKRDEENWQLAQAPSIESYKKQMTSIYTQFADPVYDCPGLDGLGAGKSEILLDWLEKKYSDWLISPTPIPLNPYYIERSPIESDCYQELLQPGAFLRIKAPRQMGKTWLSEKILTQLRRKGYQTLHYNFGLEDGGVFSDYAQFISSFAAGVTNLLDLPDCLDKYWSKNLGSNQNITKYFEKYLLHTINKPLILALDRVDCIFEHDQIAVNFCRLLRGWHERAKNGDRRGAIWRQLRLVVVHSTDVYSNLNINSSPLAGVGKIVSLPQFNLEQVQALAKRYQLEDLKSKQIDELIGMVGGHPNLITEAFEHLTNSQVEVNWQEFLQLASTDAPPFGNHLRQLLWHLKQHSELATAFVEVIAASQPIPLQSDYGFKLLSMGLVNLEGNNYSPKCNLYRQYFSTHLDEMNQ